MVIQQEERKTSDQKRKEDGNIPGNIQHQFGQDSEQPDLVSGVPARCREVGLDDL